MLCKICGFNETDNPDEIGDDLNIINLWYELGLDESIIISKISHLFKFLSEKKK